MCNTAGVKEVLRWPVVSDLTKTRLQRAGRDVSVEGYIHLCFWVCVCLPHYCASHKTSWHLMGLCKEWIITIKHTHTYKDWTSVSAIRSCLPICLSASAFMLLCNDVLLPYDYLVMEVNLHRAKSRLNLGYVCYHLVYILMLRWLLDQRCLRTWCWGEDLEQRWGCTGPKVHPVSCTVSTGSFPGLKWPGHDVHHPPTSSSEVANGLELYLHLPSVPA